MQIKEIRALTNLSQSEFSEKYKIPLATIRHWEQGQRKCPEYIMDLLEFRVRKDLEMDKNRSNTLGKN